MPRGNETQHFLFGIFEGIYEKHIGSRADFENPESPMKRRISCILQRPLCLLLFLMLVVLSLSGSLVPLWMNRVKRIESEVKFVANNINQQSILGFLKTAAFFAPFNASAVSLARILNSSLNETDLIQFSKIESKVSRTLFQAFSTIPYLNQISYIGLDGLFFSYYIEGDKTVALYSNSTFSRNDKTSYTWYKQFVDGDTGEVSGEAMKYPPFAIVNSSWFAEVLNRKNGYALVGTGWGKSQERLLLTTAGMEERGAISLAFSVKTLVDYLTFGMDSYNESLYLATYDGIVLNQGTSIHNDEDGEGKFTRQSLSDDGNFEDSMLRSISGHKYAVRCSQIELLGLQLVYAITMPYNAFSGLLDKNIRLAMVLLILIIGGMVLMICSFIYLIVEAAKKEMHLCRALINQMEATQQSEKKSMNKSLAFASASHDIRASLAALSGLIQICCREVSGRDPFRSDLMTNLQQMEICTKDLLGILNSILDTSKIEAGKMQLEEEEFEMEELIEDVVDLYHPVGMKKGVDVIFDPYDGSITKFSRVKGDRGKLKQILSNLLSNAVKFTPEGHVTVRAWAKKPCLGSRVLVSDGRSSTICPLCFLFKNKRASSELETANAFHSNPNCMEFVFEVNDTGKGILKEKRKSAFENYVQVNETTFGQEGTGLGLGIVQSLVRLMGGEIKILDKEFGERGTCIRFSVFMTTLEPDTSNNVRGISDIESNSGHYILSDSFHHWGPFIRHQRPKNVGSQVILFIKSPKRGLILQRFMQRLRIKVHLIENHKKLSPTLKRLKRKLNLSSYSSSGNSKSEGVVTSSNKSKEAPLSAFDGTDETSSSREKPTFILIVMDTHAGPFREMSRAVVEFRRDLNEYCCSRVVWLDIPDENNTRFHDLHEKLPPSDFVLSKPLHGSRLYQTIELLPEFGGIPSRRGEIHYNVGIAPARIPIHNETSTLSMVTTSGVMENSSRVSYKKAEIKEVEEPKREQPLLGRTILVADDDPIGQKIATYVASRLGAITWSCQHGEEACALVSSSLNDGTTAGASGAFDCILMDCEMPVMDGIEATRRIRKSEENYGGVRTPILALTAHDKGEEIGKMIEAGADGYITKPLNEDNFLKALARLGSAQLSSAQIRGTKIGNNRSYRCLMLNTAPVK